MSDKRRPSDVITTGEAAQIKGVSRQAVHDAIITGKIRATKSGKFWLIRRSELDRWAVVGNRPRKNTET